jgi:hypothetical protein
MAKYQIGNDVYEIPDGTPQATVTNIINDITLNMANQSNNQQQGTDNAFEFSVDQAQKLGGKGLEALGRLTGFKSVEDYGTGVVKQQEKDIAAGGYKPKYNKSFSDTFDEQGVGAAFEWIGEKVAENSVTTGASLVGAGATAVAALFSAPVAAVLGVGTLVGSAVLGTGEVAGEIEDKTGSYDPKVAVGVGAVIGFLDKFGAGKVIPKDQLAKMTVKQMAAKLHKSGYKQASKELIKRTLKKGGYEGITEGTQESLSMGASAASGGDYTAKEVKDRLIDSAVIGTSMGSGVSVGTDAVTGGVNTVRKVKDGVTSIFDKKTNEASDPEGATELANRLNTIATANDYNLQDLDKMSTKGARETVDKAHVQVTEELKQLGKDLKERLQISPTDELSVVIDKVLAQAGQREARNKTKNTVGQQEFEAIERLTGDTLEGQKMLSLMRQMNELTELHNGGYQQGLSKITDNFSPIGGGIGYDKGAINTEKVLRPIASGGAALSTGGASLLGQLGIVAGGRAIDKLRGVNKSVVDQYIQDNKDGDGIDLGNNPSLRQDAINKAKLAEQEAILAERQKLQQQQDLEALNAQLDQENAPPTPNSPQFTMEDATGLTKEQVEEVLKLIEQRPDLVVNINPELKKAIDEYRNSVRVGGKVSNLSELIRAVNVSVDANGIERTNPQNQSMMQQNQQGGGRPSYQNSPNYQRGIDDNRAFADELIEAVNNDTTLNVVDKPLLTQALLNLKKNLGSNPIETGTRIIEDLGARLKNPEAIQQYVVPYLERVTQQQPNQQNNVQIDEQLSPDHPQFNNGTRIGGNKRTPEEVAEFRKKMLKFRQDQATKNQKEIEAIENYISLVNPTGKRFNDRSDLWTLRLGDMEGMLPSGAETVSTIADNLAIEIKQNGNDFYAVHKTNGVVGYVLDKENYTDLQVVEEYQKQGIGGELQYQYRKNNPTAMTGGLSDAGLRSLQRTARRLINEQISLVKDIEVISEQITQSNFNEGDPILGSALDPFGLGDMLGITSDGIRPTPEELQQMQDGTFKPEKKQSLVEAYGGIQKLWEKATGRTTPFENTPENVEIIATAMAHEGIKNIGLDGNAIGWYDRKLKAAKAIISSIEPRYQGNEAAFDYALAVTSNGIAVADNFNYAMEVFREFLDTGRMPENFAKGGERTQAMQNAFKFFNAWNNQYGGRGNMPLEVFLDMDFTRRQLQEELNDFNKANNTDFKLSAQEGLDEVVKGSYILGAKIGQGFYQNLRGNYDPLTMDIWWMRMWNRMVGRPFKAPTTDANLKKARDKVESRMKDPKASALEKQIIKKSLKELGLKRAGLYKDTKKFDAFITQLHKNWNSYYKNFQKTNKKNPPKPPFFKTVGTHVKNINEGLMATPFDAKERSYMRSVTARAIELMREKGYNIKTADYQALMWFPEKQLARKLGIQQGRGEDNDYLDAAILLAQSEGLTNDQIKETLPTAERGEFDVGSGTIGQNAGLRSENDGLSSEELSREEPILNLQSNSNQLGNNQRSRGANSNRTLEPTPTEVSSKLPAIKKAFEVGRKGSPHENGLNVTEALQIAKAMGYLIYMAPTQESMEGLYGKEIPPNSDLTGFHSSFMMGQTLEPLHIVIKKAQSPQDEIRAIFTAFHEISHGLAMGDGSTGQPITEMGYGRLGVSPKTTYRGSVESELAVILNRIHTKVPDAKLGQDIANEMVNIRFSRFAFEGAKITPTLKGGSIVPRDSSMMQDIRDRVQLKMIEDDFGKNSPEYNSAISKRVSNMRIRDNYQLNISEILADSIAAYLVDPKKFKEEAPLTAEFLKNSLNDKPSSKFVKFYTNPIATILAVLMTALALDDREEEQQPQMSAGALQLGQGALSA